MSSTTSSEKFMREAIALALENVRSGAGGPFAALIVKDERVIARGTNLVTSANDPTAHAEIVAIREACQVLRNFQLEGCELYATCEPCPMCLGAIYWTRPSRIFYASSAAEAAAAGFDDQFIYEEMKLPAGERRIPMTQMLREESLPIFAAWAKQPNRLAY
jgi:tRNA(Arg) A34 adenosine deaminase TadA